MSHELHEELHDLVLSLGDHLRLVRDLGWPQRPAPAVAAAAEPVIETEAPRAPASEAGAAQATLFGAPSRPSRPGAERPSRPSWTPNPRTAEEAAAALEALRHEIGDCTRCRLHQGRGRLVFGEGDPRASVVFAGEGPGQEEDRTGRPFVGRAGQLLDRIIQAMGLKREQVYICNVVKCRPPNNRTPQDDEMRICGQFLARQLDLIQPRHIVCLGATAAHYLLNSELSMAKLRGRLYDQPSGARLLATYHPAYLLRNESAKKLVWQDVQLVMAERELPPAGAEKGK